MLSQLLDRRHPWRSSAPYAILPTVAGLSSGDDKQSRLRAGMSRRYQKILLCLVVCFSVLGVLYWFEGRDGGIMEFIEEDHVFPPLYEQYIEGERALPQHDISLPPPEGKHAKFFWAANHVHASGWGNALQEVILNAHLAHAANRAYVFDNYTWNRDGPEYSDYNGKLIPSRIPLSAMISGPIIGGPLPADDDAPRSVSKEWFYKMCPNRTIVTKDMIMEGVQDASAQQVADTWVEKLNAIEDPCVEVEVNSFQIFDIWIFGSTRLLDIWPALLESPMLKHFSWSPLIHAAYQNNIALFEPRKPWESFPWFHSVPLLSSKDPYRPVPGLLALHIRRGDFADHCHHVANWSSAWNGFNSFPSLPDQFAPPPGGGWGETTPENRALYMRRCFPSVEEIVERIEEVRRGPHAQGLNRIYVMTNGSPAWIAELKAALHKAGHWDSIHSSRDMKLSWEQKYVAQAVDMMIGQKAQVFIGNGFSSLTSNVVMFRMAKRFPPETNRFW